MRRIPTFAVVLVATAVLACGEKKAEQQTGMRAMTGMTRRSDSLMPLMRAHLDSLAGMSPAFAARMLAAHDAMASRMLDAMGSDMRMMSMPADTGWTALTDSIRRDLADLPSLSGRQLDARVRAHVERTRRLLDMHEGMMRMHR